MALVALISSIIGGLVVAVVNAALTQRHALIMKRELYREVLYREKVAAYCKVYALATAYIQDHQNLEKPSIGQLVDAYDRAAIVKKEIENSGLFMPEEVMATLGAYDEISYYLMQHPAIAKQRYELEAEPPDELLVILTFTDQLKSVVEKLRDDLGVETLTADLNEFFRTAALKPGWAQRWKQIIHKGMPRNKADKSPK